MSRGFALAEMLIVLAVFAMIAGMAMLRTGDWLDRFEVSSACDQLAADLHWMRQVSINSTESFPTLSFSHVPPYGYYVQKNANQILARTFPAHVMIGNSAANITFGAAGTPPLGNSDMTIMLKSTRNRSIQKTVIIQAMTGRIRIE